MNRAGYIRLMRRYLGDPAGMVWRDSDLSAMIDKASRDYAGDTMIFVGQFDFVPDLDGTYHYPDDFISFKAGWNEKGEPITPGSSLDLSWRDAGYLSVAGSAERIFDDLDSSGEFRLYPNPSVMQNVSVIADMDPFGVFDEAGFGFELDGSGFGIIYLAYDYEYAGTVFYVKTGDSGDIGDYMAVVFGALALAFSEDSDFADSGKATFFREQYRRRIAKFMQIKTKCGGSWRQNIFF